jgi:hypothetical protein
MRLSAVVARGVVAGALVLGLCAVPGAAARADVGGGSDPSGYTASVRIHFHGSGVPGGDVYRSVTVHPSCWWSEAPGPATDAKAMLAWYDEVTGGATDNETLSTYGPRPYWVDAVDREAAGEKIIWEVAFCKNSDDYTKFGINGTDNGVGGGQEGGVTWITFLYKAFGQGDPIPAPRVDPEELARAAREVMTIPKPETDRNPKVKAAGAPTLVGLPTWFWVLDPKSVGDNTGELDVTASLDQPDGLVWATVTAKTHGLRISSAYGGTAKACGPIRAQVKYGDARATDASACTVVFTHAKEGLAVTATTEWTASWVGTGHAAPTTMDGLVQQANSNISVAEVQNIVNR